MLNTCYYSQAFYSTLAFRPRVSLSLYGLFELVSWIMLIQGERHHYLSFASETKGLIDNSEKLSMLSCSDLRIVAPSKKKALEIYIYIDIDIYFYLSPHTYMYVLWR